MKDARRAHQGEIAKVEREVAAHEARHLMTSSQMQARLSADEIEETWEICQWLMTLHRLEALRGANPSQVARTLR